MRWRALNLRLFLNPVRVLMHVFHCLLHSSCPCMDRQHRLYAARGALRAIRLCIEYALRCAAARPRDENNRIVYSAQAEGGEEQGEECGEECGEEQSDLDHPNLYRYFENNVVFNQLSVFETDEFLELETAVYEAEEV